MFNLIRRLFLIFLLLFCLVAVPDPARSMQVTNSLRIDAFGTQGYYLTSKNNYFGPNDTQGSFDFNAFNLVIKAQVDPHFSVWAKIFTSNDIEDTVELTWAFGEIYLNDQLQLRVGKVIMPLGIYTEIRGVYPILPTSVMPEIYIDTALLGTDELKGVSLTGRLVRNHLKVAYDLYGGRTGGDIDSEGELQVENLIGTRIWFLSLDEDLKFGLSLFHGTMVSPAEFDNIGVMQYVASAEYHHGSNFAIRGEWALQHHDTGEDRLGYYVELTYLINEVWMPVIRYDEFYRARGDTSSITDYQKDTVLGLNYRITNYLGWKGEVHLLRGAALLDPDLPNPSPQGNWSLFITSVTFLF